MKIMNARTTKEIQTVLFQSMTFLPSRLPKGIRLNSARMPLSTATIRRTLPITLVPKGTERSRNSDPKITLTLGPAADIFPFVSRFTNP